MSITKFDDWFTGEDQLIEWDIRDNPGDPVDISGWSIQFKMATTPTGTSVLTKTASQVATSRCRVSVSAADTSALTPKTYYYTISRIDASLNSVLDSGTAILRARVA